eukprot:TRINITY_DN14292_c0_g2_i1.p1 TRINITY_DN14292_c0_g2~~TRINITY_DN14292_c0_g2_i1.p1  ORF type:complete len:302 (+),score=96.90 TRINITY_DN14292_c0_g2_i1:95-1000(+)
MAGYSAVRPPGDGGDQSAGAQNTDQAVEEYDPGTSHPVVLAMRDLFKALHNSANGRNLTESVGKAAGLAHDASFCGAAGDHDGMRENREELVERLDTTERRGKRLEPQLKKVYQAVRETSVEVGADAAPSPAAAAGLGRQEVEDLVLGHLCAYPDFLAERLLTSLLQQVALGQAMLNAGGDEMEGRIDVEAAERKHRPQLSRHRPLAKSIAKHSCERLMEKSEMLAVRLLHRMDFDGDGVVSEEEFLAAALHALAVEIENVLVSTGSRQMLESEDFADDFHQAMAVGMGIDIAPSNEAAAA